jgi:hypothetical protein
MVDFAWKPTPAQADLIAVINDASVLPRLPPERLDLTLRLLRRSRLLGRVAYRLRSSGEIESLPWVIHDQLASALVVAEARERIALWELDRIAVVLDGMDDVPVVAMKGCAYLLVGTPNAGGRIFADVDLMVPEERLGDVEQRLRSRGWQLADVDDYDERYYRQWAHELPPMSHPERGVELDLHHNIVMRTARLKPSAALLLEAARPVPGSRFKVLAPVDMVLHAMAHLFAGGEMDDALRELVDIDSLIRHFSATEPRFWESLGQRSAALDLMRPAFYALHFARALLGTPVWESVAHSAREGAPSSPVLWTMGRLTPHGLFPRNPDRRSHLTAVARLLLYMRSHAVKMPAGMLAKHLSYKYLTRHFGDQKRR